MSTWRLLAMVTTISVMMLPAHLARSQGGEESIPSFDERWRIVPGAKAAEPVASPDPQTRTVPNSTQDLRTEPESTTIKSGTPQPRTQTQARAFVGKASFYAYTRGKTASGASYNPRALTAAHRTLPFGTRLRVTDLKTKKSVDVVVNDRGPAIRDRFLDLSLGAAEVLGMTGRGLAQVRADVIAGAN